MKTYELRPAETRLRQEMHNVSLVCELDLSLDGDTYKLARDICWVATANGNYQMLFRYPAATVSFLTAEERGTIARVAYGHISTSRKVR